MARADRNPLHLAARELVRVALGVAAHFDQLEPLEGRSAAVRLPGQLERQLDVLGDRQRRQKLKELKDEADLLPADARQRRVVGGPEVSSPSISTRPEVGKSMAPARLSSVVLPHPERPTRATNSPGATLSETLSIAETGSSWSW